MNMQRPIRPTLSPADERRRVQGLQRQEIMLEEEVQAAHALVGLLDDGGLRRDAPPMTPRQIQALFPDASDRSIKNGVVGRVLALVGVQQQNTRVQPWQVVDALDQLDERTSQLHRELADTQWNLGKLSYEAWQQTLRVHAAREEGSTQDPEASREAAGDSPPGHGDSPGVLSQSVTDSKMA